jgi:hypothetical protein
MKMLFSFCPRINVDLNEAPRKVLLREGGLDMLATADSSNLLVSIDGFNVCVIVEGSKGVKYRDEYIEPLRILVEQAGLDPFVLVATTLKLHTNNTYVVKDGLPFKYCESHFRILTELGFSLDASMVTLVPDKEFTTKVM